jgi:hypothetical protein
MYTIVIVGEAAPPWIQLLEVWRRLAAATFPPAEPLAESSSLPLPPLPPLFAKFSEWAQGKGLCSRLRFDAITGCGYGCIACDDIAPGDVVITVPAAVVISSDAAMDSSLAPLLAAIDGLDAGGRALLFALCENAQADSEWRTYFDFLPRDFQTPLQWNEAELQLLQGTPLYERVVFECDSLRQFFEQLFPALSDAYPTHYPAESCTWDVFLWLRCLFDSRAFHLKAKDGSLMPSLLPGADMFNYSLRPHVVRATTIRNDASTAGDVEFAAAAACSAGQQVFHM